MHPAKDLPRERSLGISDRCPVPRWTKRPVRRPLGGERVSIAESRYGYLRSKVKTLRALSVAALGHSRRARTLRPGGPRGTSLWSGAYPIPAASGGLHTLQTCSIICASIHHTSPTRLHILLLRLPASPTDPRLRQSGGSSANWGVALRALLCTTCTVVHFSRLTHARRRRPAFVASTRDNEAGLRAWCRTAV